MEIGYRANYLMKDSKSIPFPEKYVRMRLPDGHLVRIQYGGLFYSESRIRVT